MSDSLLYGAIADDFTGGSDLASMLSEQGIRVVLILGCQPDALLDRLKGKYDAAVIALRSRSIPVSEACSVSLQALEQLQRLRVRQIQFKYCSTFDSTPQGNIGPVTNLLLDSLGVDFTVAVPALPINKRTQYYGHLFVGSEILSESPMRFHPVTPMTDSNLVHHLQAQTTRKVGLIPYPVVVAGAEGIQHEISRLRSLGFGVALVDAIDDRDLQQIAEAVVDFRLITGSSGLAMKLPSIWVRKGLVKLCTSSAPSVSETSQGLMILSGSCSAATLEQVRHLIQAGCPAFRLDVLELLSQESQNVLTRICSDAITQAKESRAIVYSSASPEDRKSLLEAVTKLGFPPDEVHNKIEHAMSEIARQAIAADIRRLIVAGGDTASAVMSEVGVQGAEVLGSVDPGVPCLRTLGDRKLTLVLKSGNFGSPDFFLKAIRYMDGVFEQRKG